MSFKVDPRGAYDEIKGKSSIIIKKFLFDIERRMKISLTGPKTGRKYLRRGKTKTGKPRFHRASAPGEAPATDTGFLMSGIRAQMTDFTHGIITIAAPYAGWLEFGTRKMEPRPYIRPAVDSAIERLKSQGTIPVPGELQNKGQ